MPRVCPNGCGVGAGGPAGGDSRQSCTSALAHVTAISWAQERCARARARVRRNTAARLRCGVPAAHQVRQVAGMGCTRSRRRRQSLESIHARTMARKARTTR